MHKQDLVSNTKTRIDCLDVSDDYGSRSVRRRQVLALYGGYVPIIPLYAWGYGGMTGHGKLSAPLGIAFLLAILVCAGFSAYGFFNLTKNTYVNAPNMRDERLDERWKERRNRAVLYAFRTVAMLLAIATAYSEVALSAEHWTWMRNPYLVRWFLWLGFLLSMTLPTAIMAWNEPDPLPE